MPKDSALLEVESYIAGRWEPPDANAQVIESAISGAPIARAGTRTLDMREVLHHARAVGGPALRKLGFHDRARLLKALALHLHAHRDALYTLSFDTGATRRDHGFDVDGGIATMRVMASKGRREMPDGHVYVDGPVESLGPGGQFVGQHIAVPLQGAAVLINAFNFPVWGMLEKLATAFLAGMPVIVKPATATCYVTAHCVRVMLDSTLLPDGALQLVSGGLGDMLDHLDGQDVVSFTGSAATSHRLKVTPNLVARGVRFMAEQDSLNATVVGPDAMPGSPEYELVVQEILQEITVKAGQKCTAIRRVFVPERFQEPLVETLKDKLGQVHVGDPRDPQSQMGALVSSAQKQDVLDKVEVLATEAERVTDDPRAFRLAAFPGGAFVPPTLFHCPDPDRASAPHATEAFGPVATVMPYRDASHVAGLLNRGQGSLVASVFTTDSAFAREMALTSASFHGRLYFNNRAARVEATGHGAPLPHMIHGGPGRAGGGEELGGVRGVLHYMQRTAVLGTPDIIAAIMGRWVPGAQSHIDRLHPFSRTFDALRPGEQLTAGPRTITLEDIETFADFTGDRFYAHMDEKAAAANPFFPGRVAHGYLLLSFAAGLFVAPDPGPVLANTGLDNLRFVTPVSPGDAISVTLTVKAKTRRTDMYGEVRWHVRLFNHDDATVATYDLLTMNAI